MPSCPYGSYMNEDGNCISVDSVPAERTCSAGYQPYEKGCVRRDLIQAIPFCSKPAFQLFQRGPEAECVQLMEKDPLFSCHEGVLEDGLCIIRTQEEPAVSCSLGFDLVAQDLRPPQCERVVFVDPEPLCEDGWDLSPHPETGENSCVSIRKTPPVAVCPEEGDYTLVDGECLRVELTEPEPMCPPGFVFNRWDAMCRRVKAQGAVPVCREGWRYVEETGKCTIEEEPTYICEAEDSRTRKQGFGEVPQSGVEPLEVPMKLFPSTSTGRHEWDSTEGATGVINFECATVEIAEPRMGCAAGELLLMQDRADPDTTVVGNDFTEKAFFLGEEGSSSLLTADSDQGSPPPYTQKSRLHQKKVPGEAGSSSVNPGSGRLKMVQLRRGGASASGIAVGHAHDSRESLKLTNKSVSATEATSNPQEKKRRNPVNGPMLKLSSKAGGKEDEPDAQDRRTDTAFTESNASPARGAHKWIESRRLSAKAGDVSRMNEVLSPMTNSRRLSSLDSGFRSVEGDSVCRITFATKPTLMPAACPVQVAAGAWNSKGKENLDGECVEVHVQRPKLRCPSGEILDDTFVTPRCEQVEIEPPTMLCPDGSSPVDGGRCIRLHSQPPLALCEEHYEVQASTGRCVRAFNEPPGWTCPTGYRLPETELPAQSAKEIVAPHLGSRKGDTASPVIIGPPLPPVQAGFCERVEFSSVQFVCPVGFGRVKDKKTKEWVCIADKAVPSTLLCESGFFLEDGLCVMHLRMAPSLVDQDGRPFPCVTRPDGTNSCGHAAPYQVALGTDDTAKHSRTGSKK
ncbi:oocyst wall related protein [Cystoisospora suis]|uniref:Oocyst wall related protein n=1 Tax=Cystoisospora suis TaxID=483139 RepID=A0A2C6KIV4_9APIC|nr:oocyst wall related protein [Cystoisospora suis]